MKGENRETQLTRRGNQKMEAGVGAKQLEEEEGGGCLRVLQI